MPAPLVWGATFLASVGGSLFASTVDFFTKKVGKKIAVRAVFAVSVGTMMLAFCLLIQGMIATLLFAIPAEYCGLLEVILPARTNDYLAAAISATIARRLYDMKVTAAKHTWLGI